MKPTYDELVARQAAIWKVLNAGAAAKLRLIRNVKDVGVGAKQTAGKVTGDSCIRVYVNAKIPLNLLPPDQQIPAQIDGVATDVNVNGTIRRYAADLHRYRPVKGGISVSNMIRFNDQGTANILTGTFGCTATRRSGGKPVLLTNWHVLGAGVGAVNNMVFNPGVYPPGGPPPPHTIYPEKNDDMIAKIVGFSHDTKTDAAIAQLDVSSCCRCCGLEVDDEIVGLTDPDPEDDKNGNPPFLPTNKILGMRPAVHLMTVYKRGIKTLTRRGVIVDASKTPDGPFPVALGAEYSYVNQIAIANDMTARFSDEGDSGSAIIDQDNFIVGLLFGMEDSLFDVNHRDQITYANQIQDVCDGLQIDINLSKSSSSSGPRVALPPRLTFGSYLSEEGNELYARAREQLLADPAGAWLFALGEEHREELVTLVTTRRPVTVLWHRLGGPAFFAAGIRTLRAGGDTLPIPAGGITLLEGLIQMGDVLTMYGSPELRDAIATHRELLLAAVRDSVTVPDILAKLNAALPVGSL